MFCHAQVWAGAADPGSFFSPEQVADFASKNQLINCLNKNKIKCNQRFDDSIIPLRLKKNLKNQQTWNNLSIDSMVWVLEKLC